MKFTDTRCHYSLDIYGRRRFQVHQIHPGHIQEKQHLFSLQFGFGGSRANEESNLTNSLTNITQVPQE